MREPNPTEPASISVAATQLRRQYYLWKARADQYRCDCKDDERKCEAGQEKCKFSDYKFNILVNNCEDIILREAIKYANLFRADQEHSDGSVTSPVNQNLGNRTQSP
jgi:hypothetical protein